MSPELVQHILDYYESQYDLTITLLNPMPIPIEFVNRDREQVESQTLAEFMASSVRSYPETTPPVVIGITPLDLYIEGKDWRYAFGIRGSFEDPDDVISYARMDPEIYGQGQDQDRLFSRVRKLLSKYLGLLYYGLQPSTDSRSPLFDNILGPRDLDRMREPLPVPEGQ